MEISLEWLADFVEIPLQAGTERPALDLLCDRLMRAGIEVDEISDPASRTTGVVVAEVVAVSQHPDADRLHVCEIHDGNARHRVVCGAPNVARGQRVAYAAPGAVLPAMTIGARAIRGIKSEGMLASRAELGLEEKSEGIWVLPESYPLGADVMEQARVAPRLTLSITPNRPDLLSHLGVAREVAAAGGGRLKASTRRLTEKGPDVGSLARLVVEEPAGCRRYVARVVRNLRVGPSPAWLRDRLERIGQRSINNVVDTTNYVLHELGQPLHAFDLAKLGMESGLPTIRVRNPAAGEELVTLDSVERALHPDDLVIADAKRPVALAGVMGGASSEVSDETTAVLIESAYFDPVRIRRTAKRHGLHTEASHRFERGADPGILVRAADRCAQILAEIAGGEVAKGILEVTQKAEPPREIALRLDRVERLLGIGMAAEMVVQLLEPLEIRCVARNGSVLRFQPPSFRPDLSREIDLIEELARRYGYDRIPERLPSAAGDYRYEPPPADSADEARRAMFASGLSEAVTWGFGSPSVYADFAGEEPLRIMNPLGEELSALRTSLLPGLLAAVGRNQRHGARHVRLFEIGTTFHHREPAAQEDERDQELPREVRRLACVLWGGRHLGRWYERGELVDFSDLAGVLETLVESFDLAEPVERVPAVIASLHPRAGAELRLGGECIGTAGQLHPDWAERLDVAGPVFVAELSLDALANAPARAVGYVPLPRFPGTRRDLAVIAERTLPAERIRAFIAAHAGGSLGPQVVERVRLFDVYRGKPIPATHVSLAYAIEYRSPERTLTDAEVSTAFEGLIDELQNELKVEVRRAGN